MIDLRKMTREFLLDENKRPDWKAYLQSIEEALGSIRIRSQRDSRRVELARHNLKEIRRYMRRMEEQVTTLEEQLKVLEEQSAKKRKK
tara:strand:+ start:909 stop:1172 length:264 start_codon:yes stop_codon:yes gene_type:complete